MKQKTLALLSGWIVLLGCGVVAQAETLQEEAARRLPPVLDSIVMPEKILSGQPNTIEWTLTGYNANYKSKVALFNCAGKAQFTCGSDSAEAFANSGDLAPTSSENGAWDYEGVLSKSFHYTYTFTAPTVAADTEMVIRFFQMNNVDETASKGSLSLLLPGGLPPHIGYYDHSGRRLLVKIIDPSAFPGDGSPRVSTITTQSTDANTASVPIAFSIADLVSHADNLQISISSSNTALINPNGNVFLTGSGEERFLKIIPTTGQAGSSDITVTVSDGTHSTTKTFTVNVGSSLSIGDITVTEGDTGSVAANFPVTLDKASGQAVSVNYATSAVGNTTANVDYTTSTGTLTIAAGQTSGVVSVPVLGDTLDEVNDVFRVTLSNPVNVFIADAQGDASITDNDPAPTVAFTAAIQSVNEGAMVTATLQLSAASGLDISVPFTASGTATSGTDYSSLTASPVTIAAGSSSVNVTFSTSLDAVADDAETVVLTLGTPTYATLGTNTTHTATLGNVVLTPIVPKTGQTTSYVTGDDGALQKGVAWPNPRFSLATPDNGTVTDNLTGLIWLTNANCFGAKIWTEALSSANLLASGSCGLTDSSVAGDWRLPNYRELESLIDLGRSNPALPTGHPFSGVQSSYYWSGSTSASYTSGAWSVVLNYGYVDDDGKTNGYYVWPVRGGQ